ncbi:hypothetical protein [Rubripirellula reticaptiva]|uniref:Uncharacterized protein n=1 Tax=Rubripirellula reticaptiva TaxID=2528013 RepID=A0A5C6F7W9_9BACT|nr:hypothetical protein [Rubripirellula reticaptiva]TWU57355.1 hypothetical protein Poly59_02620 [Rubripirellula reticaptiva]
MTQEMPRRDFGFIAIVALVAVTAAWILLMPWVPAIASATLHRFHLRSSSFVVWAAQFPIPSMYNFANRFEMTDVPPGLIDPILLDPMDGETDKRYVNHFPFRWLTFSNARHRYLRGGRDCWLTIDSSYRGQTLQTRVHAKPDANVPGGFVVIRLPEESSR